MRIDQVPLFDALKDSKKVLIAGAGGGFDVFCGLPLFFALEAQGKEVQLANLSFSDLSGVRERPLASTMAKVTADADGFDGYFPEKHLCEWFRSEGREVALYAFQKSGVVPLREAYERLVSELRVDTVVLVDGGTDSLMRGDEPGLGTPAEDMASIAAVYALDVPHKFLTCLGFGVDTFHGVGHYYFLEAVAELARQGAFLGTFSLHPAMPAVARYLAALDFVHARAPLRASIVNTSIQSAIEGRYGDVHRTERTRGSELWINPLMAQYFSFALGPLAERVRYLPLLAETQTMFEVVAVIEGFRRGCDIRPRRVIPA